MSFYNTTFNDSAPAAGDTLLHLKGSASLRIKLAEFTIGSSASPVEQTAVHQVNRTTTTGTTPATSYVEVNSDPLDGAAPSVVAEGASYSTEPTIGNILKRIALHQKNTHRFVAYPGRELISIAAANNGLAIHVLTMAVAFALDGDVQWEE